MVAARKYHNQLEFPPGRKPGVKRDTVANITGRCNSIRTAAGFEIIPEKHWDELADTQWHQTRRASFRYIMDQDGVGCHDDQTEVLTEQGWQRWSEYDQISALGTINPKTHAMEFQLPTAIHAYEYDGPLHYREHRSMSMAVTPNHRMYVRRWNENDRRLNDTYDIVTADQIGWYAGLLAAPIGVAGTEIESVRIGKHRYSADDFIALAALVASDGWAGGTESTRERVSFCCFRQDRIEMVSALAARVGFREELSRPGVWVQRNPELAEWMRANIYTDFRLRSIRKRIPSIVKCASSRQAELFLGFYGDQHIENGRRAFYTSSPKMADDLQEMILRVGKRAGICQQKPRDAIFPDGHRIVAETGNPSYTISEWTGRNLSLESKKMDVERYRGMVYCATVPNSLLVTRRNRQVLISGNSCAAESAGTNKASLDTRQGLRMIVYNPWSIYWYTSGGRDQGSSIGSNVEYLRDNGICPEEVHPRSLGWRREPSAEAKKIAKLFRLVEFFYVQNWAEFVSALLQGFNLHFGYPGHAITAMQYMKRQIIRYCNSWGDWGDDGFGTLSRDKIEWDYGVYAYKNVLLYSDEDWKPKWDQETLARAVKDFMVWMPSNHEPWSERHYGSRADAYARSLESCGFVL